MTGTSADKINGGRRSSASALAELAERSSKHSLPRGPHRQDRAGDVHERTTRTDITWKWEEGGRR